jgi:hypothetical protein
MSIADNIDLSEFVLFTRLMSVADKIDLSEFVLVTRLNVSSCQNWPLRVRSVHKAS